MKVLLTCPPMISRLSKLTYDADRLTFVVPDFVQTMTEDALVQLLSGGEFDAWIIGDDPATRRVFEAGRRTLKRVVKWGAGIDNVDTDALRDLDIPFTNTPGLFGESVSDVAIGMLLALTRSLPAIDRGVRSGQWPKPCCVELASKRVCIVGLGNVGQAVARKLNAFRCDIWASDPAFVNTKRGATRGVMVVPDVRVAPLEEASAGATALIITCELNKHTRHLIDAACLDRLADDAYVINVSRGQVVSESALLAALRLGRVRGVGLDVFEIEPLPESSALRQYPDRTILGTHNGSNTQESVDAASARAIEFLLQGDQ